MIPRKLPYQISILSEEVEISFTPPPWVASKIWFWTGAFSGSQIPNPVSDFGCAPRGRSNWHLKFRTPSDNIEKWYGGFLGITEKSGITDPECSPRGRSNWHLKFRTSSDNIEIWYGGFLGVTDSESGVRLWMRPKGAECFEPPRTILKNGTGAFLGSQSPNPLSEFGCVPRRQSNWHLKFQPPRIILKIGRGLSRGHRSRI